MIGMANGIAHVSFAGGSVFVPARNPDDRQMLMEHIAERVRAQGQVQVLVDEQRWLVRLSRGALPDRCSNCGCSLDAAGYAAVTSAAAFCVSCAFGAPTESMLPYRQPQRRPG